MMKIFRRTLPLLLAFSAIGAQAQYFNLHGTSISAGGTGQFNTILEQNPQTVTVNRTTTQTTTFFDQRQDTTFSAGFLTSMQFHPVPWAGVEFNYGYTRYSERYSLNDNTTTARLSSSVPVNQHEATGAYLFHPKHILFQPFMGVGGGAIDFNPAFPQQMGGSNQWRGAGLLEAGFDLPTMSKHIAFRVEGRGLFYRSPNFYNSAVSTRSWRAQSEPVIAAVYRF